MNARITQSEILRQMELLGDQVAAKRIRIETWGAGLAAYIDRRAYCYTAFSDGCGLWIHQPGAFTEARQVLGTAQRLYPTARGARITRQALRRYLLEEVLPFIDA